LILRIGLPPLEGTYIKKTKNRKVYVEAYRNEL